MLYGKQWEVESTSSNATHTVSLMGDGTYQCSCIGWTRHVPRRDCKHITWVRNGGGREIDPLAMAMLKAQRRAA